MTTSYILISFFSILCSIANGASLNQDYDLSEDVSQYVLDLHNVFRSRVATGQVNNQPSAANMFKMVWNNDLAERAKSMVQGCNMAHSGGSGVPGFDYAGENLSAGTMFETIETDEDLKEKFYAAIAPWFNEHPEFSYPSFCSGECGHYTQLVWGNSKSLGCGIAQCNGLDGWEQPESQLTYLVACEYGPGGNIDGQSPYDEGEACSNCPNGCDSDSNGLCAPE